MLLTAHGTEVFPITASTDDILVNYRDQKDGNGETQYLFNQFVLSLTVDLGAKIRINDQFGILFLLHFESSVTNFEGHDAAEYFPSEQIDVKDIYGSTTVLERAHTTYLMGGLTLGLQYTPNANKSPISTNGRKYRPKFWR